MKSRFAELFQIVSKSNKIQLLSVLLADEVSEHLRFKSASSDDSFEKMLIQIVYSFEFGLVDFTYRTSICHATVGQHLKN